MGTVVAPANPSNVGAGLPLPLSPLVGREDLLGRLRGIVAGGEARLVTLTGPGGVGKTRLALQAAIEASRDLGRRGYFVDLASIADPDLVLPAIALALGLQESGAHAFREVVISSLRATPTLLLLDNFEQVLTAAPVVSDLLRSCARLTILATSRSPLRVSGEVEITVPPLALPPPGRLSSPEDLLRFGAVRFFVERARASGTALPLTAETAPDIAAICRRLDGLPLALELAATWCKTLSPSALRARLEPSLPLLTGGPRDYPARLRTMADAIAWSYGLLTPDEQALFRRLSVFAGGCTIEATQAVSRGVDLDVLDGLAALIDHSLIRRESPPDGEPRFAMLETIREFATAQLEASGEADRVRRAHAGYFLTEAETIAPRLKGPEQGRWLDRLEADHGNLRAALLWFEQAGAAEEALRLAGALFRFWWVRGHLSEGRGWYERLLAAAAEQTVAPVVRARALNGAGQLAELQQDGETAAALLEEALAWARQAADPRECADALNALGHVDRDCGDFDRAIQRYEAAIHFYRDARHPEGIAGCLNNQALVWRSRGDYDRAAPLLEKALSGFRQRGDRRGMAIASSSLGFVTARRGDLQAAAARHREALAIRQDLGDRTGLVLSIEQIADLAALGGQPVVAVCLIAAATTALDAIGASRRPDTRREVEQTLERCRARLDADAYGQAWTAGHDLALDQAVAAARHVLDDLESSPSAAETESLARLTARERDVLRLLAAGRTDREIGAALFISPATATRHVANIYRKLGIHSRAEATAFVRRHALS